MLVYKFGGASIKDAKSIKKMADIVLKCQDSLVVVVSAMGKTTNKLEEIAKLWFNGRDFESELHDLIEYHQDIIAELFEQHVPDNMNSLYGDLRDKLRQEPSMDYFYEYDQIVSFGELMSTKIIASYFNILNAATHYLDIREIIKTDRKFKEAEVIWDLTKRMVLERITFKNYDIYLTQGFIAGSTNNQTTTLGREGSDYSAALLAHACGAEKLVVWKDVPGIMNADPAWFPNAEKIESLSYGEAIELSYYGAKVIHPKTIKPLQQGNIPLYVNSFLEPEKEGTIIGAEEKVKYQMPVFIRKQNQALISLRSRTPEFIAETHISHIFKELVDMQISVQLAQMSAASFTLCIDRKEEVFDQFITLLQKNYEVRFNDNVEIVTIRNYTPESLEKITNDHEILIEQKTRRTAQIVRQKKQ